MENKEPGLPGRPTTLTEAISAAIIKDVSETLSINFAAEAQGIPRSTVTTWITRGFNDMQAGEASIFALFSKGVKRARAGYVHDAVKDIRHGGSGWQGTAWLMERCCAEDFGKDSELYKQLLQDYKMMMQTMLDQKGNSSAGR